MPYLVLGTLALGALFIVLLALAAANTEFFAANFSFLLILTALVVAFLAGVFVYQVFSLWRRVKAGVFGARLTARMVFAFGLMALLPGVVIYAVSVVFLLKSIESWFDVRMESALESGLALGRSALEHLTTELVKKGEGLAHQLALLPPAMQIDRLDELRETAGVQEMALFASDGRLLGFASADKSALVPRLSDRAAIWQAKLQQPWSRIEANEDDGTLRVRVVVPVELISLNESLRLLQITQAVSKKLSQDALSVDTAYREYQQLALSRVGLKRLYGLSLTLALLLSLLSALSIAFYLSERLAAPLRALARGTRAVARGDYSQVHAVISRDELGMLTQSFNRMTQQLAEARAEAQHHHDRLLETKAYLESVLASVQTGVVTLASDLRVRLVNPAAAELLGASRHQLENHSLTAWGAPGEGLRRFGEHAAARFAQADGKPWREEMEYEHAGVRRLLLLRGTPLTVGKSPDLALVFDDVTQLVRAQRDAAWGEVARRLAHEIKNPLTPIQLSAERLQSKLADRLDAAGQDVLRRATETIVKQVEAMKGLVDAFAQYARMPAPNLAAVDMNALIDEVAALYEGALVIHLDLAPGLPCVHADPALMRQVLVNLIKNAEEAMIDVAAPWLRLSTRKAILPLGTVVELCVEDNGAGFPKALMDRLFEPYASTKPKGTGLGLAIVKKIIEEHHGSIEVSNRSAGGARVCITLPCMENGNE